jgi:beta-lactamase regulating signal transducer with metallopeptidase domain
MIRFADWLGHWSVDVYLLSATLLVLALAAMAVQRQPVHRLAVAKSLLVALALLAALCAVPGWSVLHLMTAKPEVRREIDQVALAPVRPVPQPRNSPVVDRPFAPPLPAVAPTQPIENEPRMSFDAWSVAGVTELIGALGVVAWLVTGWVAARKLRRRSQEASTPVQQLLRDIASVSYGQSKNADAVDILVSPCINVPVALGLRRAVIVLPTKLVESQSTLANPQSEIGGILVHELAHIENRDLYWLALSRALLIVFWSQPLYWLARRRMRLDQESLADAAAAELTSREQYAEQLIGWARNLANVRTMRLASAVGLWEGASQLRHRVALLLNERFTVLRDCSRNGRIAAALACVAAAMALSMVTLQPKSLADEKPPNESAKTAQGIDDAKASGQGEPGAKNGVALHGTVTAESGAPVKDVRIILYGGEATRFRGQEVTTDADGRYRFDPLKTGAYIVHKPEPGEFFVGVQFKHPELVPVDGLSWHDIRVTDVAGEDKAFDMKMKRGGIGKGNVVDADSGKPASGLNLRIRNGFFKGTNGDEFLVYATTDEGGEFTSEPLSPGRYVIEINHVGYRKLGSVDARAGETSQVQLTTRESPALEDPFTISGTAVGDDGKSMVYGGVGIRLTDGSGELRSRGGGIDGRNVFGLGFGPIERMPTAENTPYGVGTHDIELFGNNGREGYKLARRSPSEPLRITDDPTKPEVENGIRYIRPNKPAEFKLVFAKDETAAPAAVVSPPAETSPDAAGTNSYYRFQRSEPNSVIGRAFDEHDQPVVGAEVLLFRFNHEDGTRKLLAQKMTDADGWFRFENVFDIAKEFPDGKFPPSYEPDDDMPEAVVRAAGRITSTWLMSRTVIAQAGYQAQVQMLPATTLRGRVTDTSGKPVAGALVSIRLPNTTARWEGAQSSRTDADGNYKIDDAAQFDLTEYPKQVADAERQTREDAARGVQPYRLHPAQRFLIVEHPDYATKQTSFDKCPGTKDVQLEPAAIFAGRVIFADSGKPAAGVLVGAATSIADRSKQTAVSLQDFQKVGMRTDTEGKYRIASLPAGKYDVWAETPGWVNEGANDVVASAGQTESVPDLKFTKGGVVSARLVDAKTSQPIAVRPEARTMILVRRAADARMSGRPLPAPWIAANSAGRFELNLLPGKTLIGAGGVEVDGKLRFSGTPTVEVKVVNGQTVEADLPVTELGPLQPSAKAVSEALPANRLIGVVVNSKGEPVAGADVLVFRMRPSKGERQLIRQTKTGGHGEYHIDDVIDVEKEFPGGKIPPTVGIGKEFLQVFVRAAGHATKSWMESDAEIARMGEDLHVELAPAVEVRGRVTDPAGKMIVGATVSLGYEPEIPVADWPGASSSRTDENGNYAIADVAAFDLDQFQKGVSQPNPMPEAPILTISHPDFATLQIVVRKAPGTQNISLEPPAVLEGQVSFDGENRSASNILVRARSTNESADLGAAVPIFYTADVRTDAQGKYRIATLPHGKYRVWAEAPEWINEGAQIVAESGKTAAVPELKLIKGGVVSVRLVDAETGKPISISSEARAHISASTASTRQSERVIDRLVAPNGKQRFELRTVPGRNSIWAAMQEDNRGFTWQCKGFVDIDVVAGQTTEIDVAVTDASKSHTPRYISIYGSEGENQAGPVKSDSNSAKRNGSGAFDNGKN